jgi:hypothetical protein
MVIYIISSNSLTFNVQSEIGIDFTVGVLDGALVNSSIIRMRIFKFQFNGINILLLDDADGNTRRLFDDDRFASPDHSRFGISFDFAGHGDLLSVGARFDFRLFDKGRSSTGCRCFRLSFDVQIQLGVGFAKRILDVATIWSTIGSRRILSFKRNLEYHCPRARDKSEIP